MAKYLTILEVSQKQAYIFSSKKLRENAARSGDISHLTGSDFFARTAGEWYREEDNLVYAGGGRTVLQFDSREQATAFAQAVTGTVLRQYPRLELFVRTVACDPARTPGENLKELSKALEAKKARRRTSFRQMDFGLELAPQEEDKEERPDREGFAPPAGYRFPSQFEELVEALPGEKADNFIAVVRIDGNAMGTRVDKIYEANTGDWEQCRTSLRRFSEGIQADFESAFRDTVDEVIRVFQPVETLPVRPVILAGDDVCFVTAGRIGLECARVFLEKLSQRVNVEQSGLPYAACAGVALVHLKYPFHRAYNLAEELCSNAKRFGAGLDSGGRMSAMDWHIEFGQLKENLDELCKDYATEDGNRLELRPVAVLVPDGVQNPVPERTYAYFRALCGAMRGEYGKIARSKMKELRTALKQGEVEGDFFLQDREISDLLHYPFQAACSLRDWAAGLERKGAFRSFSEKDGQTKRSFFFDAIELIDHVTFFEEVTS